VSYEEVLRSVSLDADASIGIYTGVPGLPGSASPNAGMQYRIVKITGAHQVGLATGAANEPRVGVLQNKPQMPGMASTVGIAGISNVVAGAAVAAGDYLVPNANGQAVPQGTSGATTSAGAMLLAIDVAAGAGDMFPALILQPA
jgi:hypothetical protein